MSAMESACLRTASGKIAPSVVAFFGEAPIGLQRELGINREKVISASHDGVHDGARRGKAILRRVGGLRQRIGQQALERDFAKRSAGFRSAENGLKDLRGLRKILARLLQLSDFLVHLGQRVGGGFQLLGDVPLRFRIELARGSDAGHQFLADLPELLRYTLHQVIELAGNGLELGRERTLHFLPHGGKLRFRTPARRAQHKRHEHDSDHAGRQPDNGIRQHSPPKPFLSCCCEVARSTLARLRSHCHPERPGRLRFKCGAGVFSPASWFRILGGRSFSSDIKTPQERGFAPEAPAVAC